jgi:hypothetical protein
MLEVYIKYLEQCLITFVRSRLLNLWHLAEETHRSRVLDPSIVVLGRLIRNKLNLIPYLNRVQGMDRLGHEPKGNSKNKRQKYVADFVSWSFDRGKKKNCEVTKSGSEKTITVD